MAMNDMTLFPTDLAAMSVSQLVALSPGQKRDVEANLNAAAAWLKETRAKFEAALDQSYGDQARTALRDSGRDFGVAHVADGALRVTFDLPKRVAWDQKRLADIVRRIAAAGERVEDYLDIEFSISESRYNAWPPALREQFAPARTVKAGKASYRLTLADGDAA
jgi:hypothetical protein